MEDWQVKMQAEEAVRVLESSAYQGAIDDYQADLIKQWLATGPRATAEREKIWGMYKASIETQRQMEKKIKKHSSRMAASLKTGLQV